MIYGYIRVSSDKQTVENQRFEINKFCEKKDIVINDWIEETISGTKNYTKRQLGNLLKKVHKDDIIICSELSGQESFYDYGDTEYLHDKGVPRLDYQGQLPTW